MIIKIIDKETLDPELIIDTKNIIAFQYDPEDYRDKYKIYVNDRLDFINVSRECYVKTIELWEKENDSKKR